MSEQIDNTNSRDKYQKDMAHTYNGLCRICGVNFSDSHGRAISSGYVCRKENCPNVNNGASL